ncbi:hypothetical protein GA392_22925 [Bacteroides xylanisolvens]|nr:hypothetical protein GA402_22035 [Bacteroides xylanisolvens]KAB6198041.1 hypothetical protein GA392_22925 [Bacteroides xylanisolvens]KAB6353651.1 hypothetical protein GA124_23035 [Bacteroides xylanisolvens]
MKITHATDSYSVGEFINEGLVRQSLLYLLCGDIPKIIKFKATNSLRVSCLFCIFKHSPQKTV